VRRFRELYPDRQIKLLYRRDDEHLVAKSRLAAALALPSPPPAAGSALGTSSQPGGVDRGDEPHRLVG
jgi:hypothetical protein